MLEFLLILILTMLTQFLQLVIKLFLKFLDIAFQISRKKSNWPYPYDRQTNKISLPLKKEQELRRLVLTGNKVEAVKQVAKLTGAGLRVSKDYVDILAKRGRK